MNFYDLIREIKNLNMNAEIRVGSPLYDPLASERIYCSVPGDKLVLPEGFYYNEKNGITNKHNVPLYTSIKVQDISLANEMSRDILEVDTNGFTEDEYEIDEPYYEEEKGLRDRITDSLRNARNRFVMFANKSGDRLVYKAEGLFNRVRNKFSYFTSKRQEPVIEEKEESKVENPDLKDNIKRLLKNMENDEYIIGRLKSEMGSSIKELYDNNPEELINKLQDYDLIRELHNFAKNDPEYNEALFNSLATTAVNIRKEEPTRINKLLQKIRYGKINEDQMKFLHESLLIEKKNYGSTVDKKRKKRKFGGASGSGNAIIGHEDDEEFEDEDEYIDDEEEVTKEDTPQIVTLSETDKRRANAAKEYSERKTELYNSLGEYEKMFVDDAAAESLEPGDNEFNMMINERTVDKNAILNYLNSLEILKKEIAFKELDEYEQMAVDDAKAEGLEPGDNEFNMLISERTVNKENILNYYKKIANANKMQSKISSYNSSSLSNKDDSVKLDEYEQMAAEDAVAETIKPGDNEFEQMVNERTVDRSKVIVGYEQLEELRKMRERMEELSKGSKLSDTNNSGRSM